MSQLRIRVIFTTNCCHGLSSMKSALFLKLEFHLAVLIKKVLHVLKKTASVPQNMSVDCKIVITELNLTCKGIKILKLQCSSNKDLSVFGK